MPAPTTTDEFLDLVRKSGVVEERKLDAYLDKLRAAGAIPSEPGKFAGLLVRDGVLTHFQAEQFLLGKWRRFNIGKYKVLERLGQGGMGSVYLCEHRLMRRRVAVKVLPTAKADDPASLDRFYREARVVAALDHPNIVRAYDIDQDEKLHFLVMEYVDGSSFQEMVKRTGPMDLARACHYIRQAAQGLQHAHETAGIVHRDIKPGNILVDRTGTVKVLDMGLARFFHDEEDILTKKYDENVLGTADYLAPEQALDSHAVDIRADIYSLGATFYFLLTGRTPFSEGTVAQKLIWHQTRQPKPIRSLRPDVPEELVFVIERMMAKDPAQRYQSPAAVEQALEPWTQLPIAPPPDVEMPQLSAAAMGAPSSDAGAPGSAPPSSGVPSPAPRKTWQVPSSGSAKPIITPTPPPAPPSPAPRGSSTPPPAGPLAQAAKALAVPPPSMPSPPPFGAPTAPSSGLQPTLITNGNGPVAAAATAAAAPAASEEEVAPWERLAPPPPRPKLRAGTPAPAEAKPARAPRASAPAPAQQKRWIVYAILGAIVVVALAAGLVLLLMHLSGKQTPQAGPTTHYVSRLHQEGHLSSVQAALNRCKAGDRIVITESIEEAFPAGVLLDGKLKSLKNITLEGEEGKQIVWRLPAGQPKGNQMITLNGLEGFTIRNLTFDGEGKVLHVLTLTGASPGLTLEGVTLRGFERDGLLVMNCVGDKDRPVTLTGLKEMADGKARAAISFDAKPDFVPALQKNRFITVTDLQVQGEFQNEVWIVRPGVNDDDTIHLPAGIKPKIGP